MSGKGPGSGFDFQSRTNAFVAAHMLARHQLRWTRLPTRDVPIAVQAESGGGGDDVRVELADSDMVYECQAKRTLNNDKRLKDAATKFAALAAAPRERGILIVNPGSSNTITGELHDALEHWAQGVKPALSGVLLDVHSCLEAKGAAAVLERLSVQILNLEGDSSPDATNAMLLIAPLLHDQQLAGAAWRVLISDGLTMCRQGGRRTRDDIVALLEQEHICLASHPPSAAAKNHAEILAAIQALSGQVGDFQASVQPSEKDPFTPLLERAKELLAEGKSQSALDFLDGMRSEMSMATPATRSRMHNMLGAALSRLGRISEARAEFGAAEKLTPQDPVVLGNLAMMAMVAGEREVAIEYANRVLAIDLTSVTAWQILAQLDTQRLVPTEVAEDPSVLAARGVAQLKLENVDEGIALLRASLALEFDVESATWLARAELERSLRRRDAPIETVLLEEARDRLDVVLTDPDRVRGARLREIALVTRGQINHQLGAMDAARADFTTAVREFPDAVEPVVLLATHYMDRDEPEKAFFFVDTSLIAKDNPMLLALRAQALIALKQLPEARVALMAADQASSPSSGKSDGRILLAELALEADAADLAEQFISKSGAPEWLAAAFSARVAVRRGEREAARAAFTQAVSLAPPQDAPRLRGEWAVFLRESGDPRGAVDVLEGGLPLPTAQLRALYGRALFESKEYGKVALLVEAERAISTDGLPVWALELGANLSLLRDDVPSAVSYLDPLVGKRPHDAELKLRLAHTLLRAGDTARAIAAMDAIRVNGDLSARQLLGLASLYIRANVTDHVLPLSYKAIRMEPEAEDIQLTYANFFLKREREPQDLEVGEVGPDTGVVLLMSDGSEARYFIVTDHTPRRTAGEIGIDDELAKALMGRHAGERIVLRRQAVNQEDVTIKEVLSKYVYVFQAVLLDYKELFPLGTALQPIKIPDEPTLADFAGITEDLRQRSEFRDLLLAKYAEACLPLGFIAARTGTTLAEAYDFVRLSNTQPLLAEFGDAADASRAAAASAAPAVLTRTAIHTAQFLDLFEAIPKVHPVLLAPQSLLDELENERVHLVEEAKTGYQGLIYRDGHAEAQSAAPEYFQRQLLECERIIAWLKAACQVRPRPLHRLDDKDEQLRDVIGASSFDTIAIAEDCEGEVYADDLGLRRQLHAQTGRFGFSTFGLLQAGRGTVFTGEQCDDLVVELIRLSHVSIMFTPDMFTRALRRNGHRLDGQMVPLLNRLRAPDVNLANIVGFIVQTLLNIAIEPAGLSHLGPLTHSMVDAGAQGRDWRQLVALVERDAKLRMQLLPLELDAIMAALQRYAAFSSGEAPRLHE